MLSSILKDTPQADHRPESGAAGRPRADHPPLPGEGPVAPLPDRHRPPQRARRPEAGARQRHQRGIRHRRTTGPDDVAVDPAQGAGDRRPGRWSLLAAGALRLLAVEEPRRDARRRALRNRSVEPSHQHRQRVAGGGFAGRPVRRACEERCRQPALWMRQTATTSDVQIVPAAPVRYDGVTYSPDGDYVYYVTYATHRRGRHALPDRGARRGAAEGPRGRRQPDFFLPGPGAVHVHPRRAGGRDGVGHDRQCRRQRGAKTRRARSARSVPAERPGLVPGRPHDRGAGATTPRGQPIRWWWRSMSNRARRPCSRTAGTASAISNGSPTAGLS